MINNTKPSLQPGTIAICGSNQLGLICRVHIPPGTSDKIVYRGIHLVGERVGEKWESTSPTRVCHVTELTDIGIEKKSGR
jgi:hypothetical protein